MLIILQRVPFLDDTLLVVGDASHHHLHLIVVLQLLVQFDFKLEQLPFSHLSLSTGILVGKFSFMKLIRQQVLPFVVSQLQIFLFVDRVALHMG